MISRKKLRNIALQTSEFLEVALNKKFTLSKGNFDSWQQIIQ